MENKKKIIIGVVAAVVVVAAIGLGYFLMQRTGGGKDKVYVEKVSQISGTGLGAVNRFAGVVEAQDSWKVKRDADKTIEEVFVEVGAEVKEGDDLFSYNTEDTKAEIAQGQLEMESINNEINDYNAQIAALSAERDVAPEEAKFDYTTQIQSIQNDLQQTEYNRKSKQLEIDKLNEVIANSVVKSKMNGVVKAINSSGMDDSGEDVFITILATGTYRVKCLINEQNMSEVTEGSSMLVRSRVDEEQTWNGTIIGIDKDSPQTTTNEYMYESSSDDTTTSSKYPFYVELEHSDGLMLGQHVFVEYNEGQDEKKDGIWLMESYLVMEEDEAYVWADNGKGKLEKRKVKLGDYDEVFGEYEIKSGLKKEDLIAWPMENLYEGITTVTNPEDVDYESPLYKSQEEEAGEDTGDDGEDPQEDIQDMELPDDADIPEESLDDGEDAGMLKRQAIEGEEQQDL